MPYRTIPLANNYFYHIFNRGVEKRLTFQDSRDFRRFLKILTYYQYEGRKPSFSNISSDQLENVYRNEKLVEVICYCLMPNHFHLLVKQLKDDGIVKFMSQIGNAYTRYFNTRYSRIGALFQGAYKAVIMESDEQLIHVSRYIHLNPIVGMLVKDLKTYEWSSYYDYVGLKNEKLVNKSEIINFFKGPQEYDKFVSDQFSYALDLARIKHQLIDGED